MSRFLAPFLILVLLGAGCSGGDDGPAPDDAAAAYAAALASGDFSAVDVRGQSSAQVASAYTDVVSGLGEVTPKVEVGEVARDGDAATAELTWTWPFAAGAWTYATTARLALVDDAWQVAWTPSVVNPDLGDAQVLDATPIDARRGRVLGARGQVLVKPREVFRFGIDRARVAKARAGESARRLAQLLDIDVAPYLKQVEAAGDRAFVVAITYRADEIPPAVSQGVKSIPGATAYAGSLDLGPYRGFASPILGSVGEVTAEMLKEHPDRYQVGDLAGISGLQARYDETLGGTRGLIVDAVNSDGSGEPQQLERLDAVPGRDLTVSLDRDLQTAAERILANVGPSSALVAIRPSTGAVLAAANGPGTGGYNVATYGQAAPGSTFKIVSSLALLRAGLDPDSTVECPRSITVDGKRFENYDDYPSTGFGAIALRTAVANSCNTAFIGEAGRVRGSALADAAASLGLGVDHDLGFPAYFGQVPAPASEVEGAADLIGQGKVLASPMVMATVIGSVQQGSTVVPWLVKGQQASADADALSSAEATALRSMLRGVVTDGSGRGLLDVPGPPVIAKTGTAEFEREGRTLTHAWMVAAQGDLAVAVYVDEGSSGSGTAGPLLEAFLRAAR